MTAIAIPYFGYASHLLSLCYPDYLEAVARGAGAGFLEATSVFPMELFLNLCWLSLLLPAFLLWRQGVGSGGRARGSASRSLVFVCVLGCALILLFPVISASDDLHAMRPEMEESESACRSATRCAGIPHALTHLVQAILPRMASATAEFEQIGTTAPFLERAPLVLFSAVPASRAPPVGLPASL
jgi:hypothetical protein